MQKLQVSILKQTKMFKDKQQINAIDKQDTNANKYFS